jgi:uncharacterized membrane protein YgaE (UPF0421/DUF939 family)
LYVIKNISRINVTIDGITISPYQSKEFNTIKDRLAINRYENRHMIQVATITKNEPKSNTIDSAKTEPITAIPDIIKVEKTKTNEAQESKIGKKKKSTKSVETVDQKTVTEEVVKNDITNTEMKGEITNASD